jgi:antitoxin component YwqK of YwqJK toxin-antitoxin module
MAKWYIKRNNKTVGPFDAARLKRLASEGKVKPDDMVRRDDQDSWNKAESLTGFLVVLKQEENLTEEVQPPEIGASGKSITEKENTVSKKNLRQSLQLGAGLFWNATKRTGKIATIQTQIAKISQFSLPAAYQVLGEAYYSKYGSDPNSDPVISEISAIKTATNRQKEELLQLPKGTLVEKAQFVAAQAASVAKETIANRRIQNCFQALGDSVYRTNNTEPDLVANREQIQSLLAKKKDLTKSIEEINVAAVPDSNVSPQLQIVSRLHAYSGKLRRSYLLALCMCAFLVLPVLFAAAFRVTATSDSQPATHSESLINSDFTDLAQIDYSYDFSKTDYDTLPKKAIKASKEEQIGEEFYVMTGYTNGGFTTHGKQRNYTDATKMRLVSEFMHIHGKPHGLTRLYDESGNVKATIPYVDGKKHGIEVWTYPNGKMKSKYCFIKGQEHGQQESWFEDGTKEFEITRMEGKSEGVAQQWFANGQKYKHQGFRNGERHGKCTYWFDDGSVEAELFYNHGKYHGKNVRYVYENGEPLIDFEGNFDNGTPVGIVKVGSRLIGGGYKTFEVRPGTWQSGTRADLLAKMKLAVICIDGGDFNLGDGLVEYVGGCPNIFSFEASSASQFFSFVGSPSLQVMKYDFTDDFDEALPFNVRIGYRCIDGPMIFHAISDERQKYFDISRSDSLTHKYRNM